MFFCSQTTRILLNSWQNLEQKLKILTSNSIAESQNNGPNNNVLEDFFAMTEFDCLIRPDSNYSTVAEILGDYMLVMHPAEICSKEGKSIVTKVDIHKRKPLKKNLLKQ